MFSLLGKEMDVKRVCIQAFSSITRSIILYLIVTFTRSFIYCVVFKKYSREHTK